MTRSVIVGGSTGIGRVIAERLAARGDRVVITSRNASSAADIAQEIGSGTTGIAVYLAAPGTIAAAFAGIEVRRQCRDHGNRAGAQQRRRVPTSTRPSLGDREAGGLHRGGQVAAPALFA